MLPLAEVLEQIGGAGLERAQVPAACLEDYNKMLSGELYDCNNPALVEFQLSCLEKLYDINATRPSEVEKRAAMLKEMFAEVGENCFCAGALPGELGRPACALWQGRVRKLQPDPGGRRGHLRGRLHHDRPKRDDRDRGHPSSPGCGRRCTSSTSRCASAATCGWAQGPCCCPA